MAVAIHDWLELLDHWQTLAAGILALVAALIAVWAARRKERRDLGWRQL